MAYSNFIEEIKNNKLNKAYLLMGKEKYLIEDIVKKVVKTYIDESFVQLNYSRIDGKDIGLEDLKEACETLPFMSDKRIVVLDNLSLFLSNNDANKEEIYSYIESLGEFAILLMIDSSNDIKKNMKIYKLLSKEKRAFEFDKLMGVDLNNWVKSIVNGKDKKISNSEINYFIQKSSYTSKNIDVNLYELKNELLKVVDYCKTDSISKDDINEVLTDPIDTNIFELLDSITRLDTQRALNLFNEIYMTNEPIQKIFYMVTRQIRLIFSYKLYVNRGYSPSLMQKKMKIGSYEFGKIKNQSNNFSINRLSRIMKELLKMDIDFKTSNKDEKLLMEIFIIRLCSVE